MAGSFSRDLGDKAGDDGDKSAPLECLSAPGDLRYVARQPILDVRGKVHGYELLFRSGPTAVGFQGNGDTATRTVLDNTIIFGLERLTGGLPVFVNCTQEALMSGLVMVLPPEHTVLELLETLKPTADLLATCQDLKARGFRLALDDYEWKPEWACFAELADYVKVDFSKTTAEQRLELIAKLRGGAARLVMERVETRADFELARREGFTLFQGYYFCRPVLMENRSIPPNWLVHLEILKALHEEMLDIGRVSDLVKQDASLTYRLLRMVNSPLYATRKVVSSIHGALVMIGDEMFRRIATLAIASELRGDQPSELLRMAFQRGRFCELAAAATGQDAMEQYLLGILSLLPMMLSVPMEELADALPLRGAVRRALLGENNPERAVLEWLTCYELGQWNGCDDIAISAGLSDGAFPKMYADALLWAETVMSMTAE
jgi:c-di-GMP phosphodiesterase